MTIDYISSGFSISDILTGFLVFAIAFLVFRFVFFRGNMKMEKKVMYFIFVAYMMSVFYITIFPNAIDELVLSYPAFEIGISTEGFVFSLNESFEGRRVNLVPVVYTLQYISEWGFQAPLGNFIMLMPFGFLVPMLFQKYNKIKNFILLSLSLILFTEKRRAHSRDFSRELARLSCFSN